MRCAAVYEYVLLSRCVSLLSTSRIPLRCDGLTKYIHNKNMLLKMYIQREMSCDMGVIDN